MRFKISLVDETPVEKMGNITNIDTEKNRFLFHTETIDSKKISNGKIRFNTGFSSEPIDRSKHFSKEEKEVLKKAQKEALKVFIEQMTGKKTGELDDTDQTIWVEGGYGELTITNDTFVTVFDTKDLRSMVAYWQILCGAYTSIGSNIQDAIEKGSKYFIEELKDAEIRDAEDDNQKIKAITILGNLKDSDDTDALLYLCWFLGNRKEGLAGFSKSSSPAVLSKYLYNFIQGNTRSTNKKRAAAEFVQAAAKYKADKDNFMINVIVKIADYHSLIVTNASGAYVDNKNNTIGKSVEECTANLAKPGFRDIFEELYNEVMNVLVNSN